MKHGILFCLVVVISLASSVHAQPDPQSKIQSVQGAAPASITAVATIVDWPSEPGGDLPVLRPGAPDWTCIVDNPASSEPDPMCMDTAGLAWFKAYISQQQPEIDRMGTVYVLRGGAPASNTDPYATGPSPDNEWMDPVAPHIGLIMPDTTALQGLPTDPDQGGPWVMFRGTPYVHVMLPLPHGDTMNN